MTAKGLAWLGIGVVLVLGLVYTGPDDSAAASANNSGREPSAGLPELLNGDDGFSGVLVHAGERVFQVVELQWGASKDGILGPAYARLADEQGRMIEADKRHLFPVLFESASEISGCYTLFGKEDRKVWIDEIQYAVNSEGYLVTLGFSGQDELGNLLQLDPARAMVTPGCHWTDNFKCLQGECIVSCPDEAYPECECSQPAPNCVPAMQQFCPLNGTCQGTPECKVCQDGMIFKCECFTSCP